jgi:predicted nucleotidyltransferase
LIARVYDPRARLASLRDDGPSDQLEEAALRLAEVLRSAAGVEGAALGVTGSLLFGLHAEASDLDMVVYGTRQGRRVRDALVDLLDGSAASLRRPRGAELTAIHDAHRSETPLSAHAFTEAQARKVNEGRFGTHPFFVRFVKLPSEVAERYGDPRYRSRGRVTLKARVSDDADALFTPCTYAVSGVRFIEGEGVDEVRSIVSFRGRFADQARAGETVLARGSLEQVISSGGPVWFRLIVGGRAGDFLVRHSH